eukprot:CAMPEP_0196589772 /NCGR_PEP_ID=MMETSP1081-20130531/64585_1 /TAXON_ID=36882 /ORGANISM="Pyramimonas amylifera, Strain CCMP720" /LENGTH=176 /DNA_ID=CAMNT_0041912669 /DNA_START=530 /DNA_END=1060 /DNA_ORIENTATION=-
MPPSESPLGPSPPEPHPLPPPFPYGPPKSSPPPPPLSLNSSSSSLPPPPPLLRRGILERGGPQGTSIIWSKLVEYHVVEGGGARLRVAVSLTAILVPAELSSLTFALAEAGSASDETATETAMEIIFGDAILRIALPAVVSSPAKHEVAKALACFLSEGIIKHNELNNPSAIKVCI